MEYDIRAVWRALRTVIKDGCTFADIKDLVAMAGLPVEQLSHLQQRSLPAKGASKSQLLDAVDDLIGCSDDADAAIMRLVAAALQRHPRLSDAACMAAQQFGWTIQDGQMRPSDFQVDEASADLPPDVRRLLTNAYSRFSQADYSGAMTAICSALDSVTCRMYAEHGLGSAQDDSYQQRAVRCFSTLERRYRSELAAVTSDEVELNRVWQNYRGAINQAAYVLGALRRNASDVHGATAPPSALVRYAMDCGTFVIRSITAEAAPDATVRYPDGS